MRKWVPVVALVLAVVGVSVHRAADDTSVSTKEVMKKLHKSDPQLFKAVVDGKASKEDKEKVVALYEALAKNKVKKGDEKDWTERTTALVAAAKEVAAGEDGAVEKLNKAANCKGCHSLHK
jgi:cytochrome c556